MTLQTYLTRLLGRYEVVHDHTWPHRASAVLEIRDAAGRHWIAKQHSAVERYHAELTAYQEWVPVLGERAPTLHHSDDQLLVLVLVLVLMPGKPVDNDDAFIHHQAGTLLRRLHSATLTEEWPEFAADCSKQLQR